MTTRQTDPEKSSLDLQSAVHNPLHTDDGPPISLHWHKRLWGDRCGSNAMVQIMVADPRIAGDLDRMCHDFVGAASNGFAPPIRTILLALHKDANADYRLGVARYAQKWSAVWFGADRSRAPDDLSDADLRDGLELAVRADDIGAIAGRAAITTVPEIRAAGAAVIAAWIGGHAAPVAAALKLRFPPDDAVFTPSEFLDVAASTRLLFAFAHNGRDGPVDGI